MKNKKLKTLPRFKNEAEEARFWQENDTAEYFDLSKAQKMTFPNLRPSTKSIALRLPVWLLETIRKKARQQDVPYQSLIKVMLAEAVRTEERPAN